MRNGFARGVVAAELGLCLQRGCAVCPCPGGCWDLFILSLGCRNCCPLLLQAQRGAGALWLKKALAQLLCWALCGSSFALGGRAWLGTVGAMGQLCRSAGAAGASSLHPGEEEAQGWPHPCQLTGGRVTVFTGV